MRQHEVVALWTAAAANVARAANARRPRDGSTTSTSWSPRPPAMRFGSRPAGSTTASRVGHPLRRTDDVRWCLLASVNDDASGATHEDRDRPYRRTR